MASLAVSVTNAEETNEETDCLLSNCGNLQIQFKKTTKASDLIIKDDEGNACQAAYVFTSPLKRTLLTAFAIVKSMQPIAQIIVLPGLTEVATARGMSKDEVIAFCNQNGISDIDTTKMPDGEWFNANESEEEARSRITAVSHKNTIGMALGRKTYPFKKKGETNAPLPDGWGSAQGFPMNFKPYRVSMDGGGSGREKSILAPCPNGTFIVIRHAHSVANAAKRVANAASKQKQQKKPKLLASS
jgi:hypothetical protein